MSAHTPGPWRRGVPSKNHILAGNEAQSLIAIVSAWSMSDVDTRSEAEANVRLIAAAPDMLVALQAIEHGLRDTRSARDQRMTIITKVEAHALALAAINKATGQ